MDAKRYSFPTNNQQTPMAHAANPDMVYTRAMALASRAGIPIWHDDHVVDAPNLGLLPVFWNSGSVEYAWVSGGFTPGYPTNPRDWVYYQSGYQPSNRPKEAGTANGALQ